MLDYLLELRQRLIKSVIAIVSVFIALSFFAKHLYHMLALPLLKHLPAGNGLIATGVAAPLLAPLKLTLVLSVFITIPYLLFQLWMFVAPALYQHERRLIWLLLFSSTLLFYIGALFAYFIVFPLIFSFFAQFAPKGVLFMPDISHYLDFTLKLLLAFGAAFEVPIAIIILVKTGISSVESLAAKRPYIVVGAFVLGMLLTPPDVLSQILLAVPIWLLYEVGLLAAKFTTPVSSVKTAEE